MADQPIRVLDLVGSPAEVGRAHGAAYAAEIREYTDERVHLSSDGVWAGHAVTQDEVIALAEACLPAHEAYDPELYAEMLAMADGGRPVPRRSRHRRRLHRLHRHGAGVGWGPGAGGQLHGRAGPPRRRGR